MLSNITVYRRGFEREDPILRCNAAATKPRSPRKPMTLEIDGKPYKTDPEGYLEDIEAWTPAAARAMAGNDEVILTDAHWEVIYFLRDYYREYAIAPSVRVLVRAVGERLGRDKAKSAYLYRLFPEGPARQACRYAGLPKPTGCV